MKLTGGQQILAARGKLYGDLYWPDHDVLLEYDGELFHTGRDKLTWDARRDNAPASKRVRRLTVTADLYGDERAFDEVMRELFRMLGVRYREVTAGQLFKRQQLSEELKEQEKRSWR